MSKIKVILLTGIILLALTVRFYQLGVNPPSLSWDEVSIGYNAYSILTTGKDEHGKSFPLDAFTAYGDYKPPFSIYLTVPSIALFGLNEFGVRFPSAFFGTLTVLCTFFLVKELFKKNSHQDVLSLLTASILAISPWHVNISRAGFEANIALFFVVLGTYLLLKANEHKALWYIAWIPYVLSMYTFNSSRYFVVLFSVGIILYSFSSIRKSLKQFLFGGVIAVVILLPLVPHLISKEARLRFVEVNIFSDSSIVEIANSRLERDKNSFFGKIVNNRRVGFARSYVMHFFDNLQPEFLFIKGDGNPKFSIQDVGELYIIEAPFFAIGLLSIMLWDYKIGLLLLYWIVTAIMPAAVARETPHALRILNSLPTWQVCIAFGIYVFFNYFKKANRRICSVAYVIILGFLYISSFIYYIHNYYVHYPVEFSSEWQYGYKEAILQALPITDQYQKIRITDSIGRPYMYTLFYTKTNPTAFIQTKQSYFDAAGFYHVDGFGKYQFGGATPQQLSPDTLYVWDAGSVPKGARIIDTVKLLNGKPVLTLFDDGER